MAGAPVAGLALVPVEELAGVPVVGQAQELVGALARAVAPAEVLAQAAQQGQD
jgi:hypothetical protein